MASTRHAPAKRTPTGPTGTRSTWSASAPATTCRCEPRRGSHPGRDAHAGAGQARAMTTANDVAVAPRAPELLGQTVVVIGGSAGIGLATARLARAEGASVILTARSRERLERAGHELGARTTAAFDATDFVRVARFFAELPGPVDHVM